MDENKEVEKKSEEEPKKEDASEKDVKENKKEKKITKEDKLKEEIAKLERALKEEKDKNLREIAEMQTTKRRLKEAEIENRKYAAFGIISELIGPIDMLLSVVNSPAPSEEVKNYQMGFQMIANQLVNILHNDGLKVIEAKEGDAFEPKLMQALNSEEKDVEAPIILKVMQKGYMYKDRVLKPVLVNVAVPKKNEESKKEENETKDIDNNEEKGE